MLTVDESVLYTARFNRAEGLLKELQQAGVTPADWRYKLAAFTAWYSRQILVDNNIWMDNAVPTV